MDRATRLERDIEEARARATQEDEDARTYSALADKLVALRDRAIQDTTIAAELASLAQLEVVLVEAELEERRHRRWASEARADEKRCGDELEEHRATEARLAASVEPEPVSTDTGVG
jgi:hypothetical protein